MFYDVELAFIPFDGKLWLSQSDIRAALAEPKTPLTPWCLDFPDELEHIDARQHTWFFELELARHTIDPETYFTIPAIGYFIRNASFRQNRNGLHRRIDGFESLLDELQAQPQFGPLVHSHTCGEEAENLRSVLDKHPHWERVMELYNLGETEGTIAEILNIKVTKVRSATQHLRKHGFDLLNGKRRDHFAASRGRAGQVPKVRLSDPARDTTQDTQSNVTMLNRDP